MKHIYLLAFLLLFLASLKAQTAKDTLVPVEHYRQLEARLNKLDRQVRLLKSRSDSVESFKKSQEEIVRQTSMTIANQNSWISTFSFIFTVMSAFLAIAGILMPILSYLNSRKAIEDFQKNVDSRITDYLQTQRLEKFNKYASALTSDDVKQKQKAIEFFKLYQLEEFNLTHLGHFFDYLTSSRFYENDDLFASLLFSKDNLYADLFIRQEHFSRSIFVTKCLPYIAKKGKHHFTKTLSNYLKQSYSIDNLGPGPAKHHYVDFSTLFVLIGNLKQHELFDKSLLDLSEIKSFLPDMLHFTSQTTRFFDTIKFLINYDHFNAEVFLNDPVIINRLSGRIVGELKQVPGEIDQLLQLTGMSLEAFNNTILGQRVKNEA